jgi:hypothetical protein
MASRQSGSNGAGAGSGTRDRNQVIVAAADKAALLEAIRQQFSGAGLRYWVTTIAEAERSHDDSTLLAGLPTTSGAARRSS